MFIKPGRPKVPNMINYTIVNLIRNLILHFPLSAREHGPSRGRLERVQPDRGDPLQESVKFLSPKSGRILGPPSLLPKWPQRILSSHPQGRVQTEHQK